MARRALSARSLIVAMASIILLAGCLNDADAPQTTGTPFTLPATATFPAIVSTVTPEPTPTMPPSLESLLDPGPTDQAPPRIIFLNGDSLWTITVEGDARKLTTDVTVGPWSQTVSGGLAAFVQTRRSGDEETQEVRFISVEGFVTGAVYGPVTTAGPDAEPEIVELAWSWDASSLAILRADGAIEALVGLDDPFFDSSVPLPLIPASRNQISAVTWGPTGDGIAYLMAGADGRHHLMVAPRDVQPIDVLATDGGRVRTVADFEWLPGRGRVAFVEDSRVPGSRAPASIFTIVPNGTALELLVSASRFAPAATIGKMNASPDARELAFFLYAPDAQGRPEFQTLWVLHIDSGELREIPVEPGYVVTDTWFMSGGLLWRGVDLGSTSIDAGTTYTGVEPFILAFTDAEGATSILFQSTLVEDE